MRLHESRKMHVYAALITAMLSAASTEINSKSKTILGRGMLHGFRLRKRHGSPQDDVKHFGSEEIKRSDGSLAIYTNNFRGKRLMNRLSRAEAQQDYRFQTLGLGKRSQPPFNSHVSLNSQLNNSGYRSLNRNIVAPLVATDNFKRESVKAMKKMNFGNTDYQPDKSFSIQQLLSFGKRNAENRPLASSFVMKRLGKREVEDYDYEGSDPRSIHEKNRAGEMQEYLPLESQKIAAPYFIDKVGKHGKMNPGATSMDSHHSINSQKSFENESLQPAPISLNQLVQNGDDLQDGTLSPLFAMDRIGKRNREKFDGHPNNPQHKIKKRHIELEMLSPLISASGFEKRQNFRQRSYFKSPKLSRFGKRVTVKRGSNISPSFFMNRLGKRDSDDEWGDYLTPSMIMDRIGKRWVVGAKRAQIDKLKRILIGELVDPLRKRRRFREQMRGFGK